MPGVDAAAQVLDERAERSGGLTGATTRRGIDDDTGGDRGFIAAHDCDLPVLAAFAPTIVNVHSDDVKLARGTSVNAELVQRLRSVISWPWTSRSSARSSRRRSPT